MTRSRTRPTTPKAASRATKASRAVRSAKAVKTAKASKPATSKPVRSKAVKATAPSKPAKAAKPSTHETATPRFTFAALPTIRTTAELTPLLRAQLVVDTRLGAGRRTTPDRIPAHYLDLGVARWRVLEAGVPVYDIVMNTVFFAGSDEPLGIERIQGSWDATGRSTRRGLKLDLIHLAWELTRDWPGRRLPVDAEPPRGKRLVVDEGLTDEPWPADATFV